jgi:hypothetical protein
MIRYILTLILSLLATVSFSQSVTLAWDNIDATAGNHASELNTLITDSNNDVYVTGFQGSVLYDDECIIVKYSADGIFQWDDSYGDMPASWNNNRNEGKVIKISATGSIIVGSDSRINGDEFQLRSYTSSGTLEWNLLSGQIQSASGARGAIADFTILPDNNLAIFANLNYSNGNGDTYSLFKLTNIGQHIWTVKYSPNSAHDFGTSVGHDPAGTIYITGGVFNFDNGTYDFTTLNIHPNATNDWIARYNHIANLKDVALDMVVDNSKNQFITGVSEITPGQTDMSTIMQNVYGTRLWQDNYGGSAGLSDTAFKIVTDNQLNSIVIGTTIEDTLGSIKNAITLIKYDGAGNRVWIRKFLGDDNLGGKAKGLDLHNNGNIYFTGDVQSNITGKDIFVACINSSGQLAWNYTYDGPSGSNDYSSDIKVTDDFKIYVTGATTISGVKKHLTFKLDDLISSVNEPAVLNNLTLNSYYSNGSLTLHTCSDQPLSMSFLLFDVPGKTVLNSTLNVPAGEMHTQRKIYLGPGIYIVKLISSDKEIARKITVIE